MNDQYIEMFFLHTTTGTTSLRVVLYPNQVCSDIIISNANPNTKNRNILVLTFHQVFASSFAQYKYPTGF